MPIRKDPRRRDLIDPPILELPQIERPEPILAPTPPQQHPDDIPLDHDSVAAALWHAEGNVHRAALLLATRPARVQYLVSRVPWLDQTRRQAADLLVDKAEEILHQSLEDPQDPARQDNAARFILEKAGRSRGWSKDGGSLNLAFDPAGPVSAGVVQIRWDIEGK